MIKIIRLLTFITVVTLVFGLVNGKLSIHDDGGAVKSSSKVIKNKRGVAASANSTSTTVPWGTIADEGIIYRLNAPAGTAIKSDTVYKVSLFGIKENATATNETTSSMVKLEDFTQSWAATMFAGYLSGVLVTGDGVAVVMDVQRPYYTPEEKDTRIYCRE